MPNASKPALRKHMLPARGVTSQKSLASELSDVLDIIRQHAALLPAHAEHTKIELTLKSGERLELEFRGRNGHSGHPEESREVCLGHDLEKLWPYVVYSIDDLDLGASAKAAAESLQQQFPNDVKFTSGRRSIAQQAAAMAPNVVNNRNWIQETYPNTPQRAALQKWVDDNPNANTAKEIAAGLEGVMNTWSESQQRSFSRHITGDAFDIQPVTGAQGDKIKQAIAKLPKLQWHTFKEGGLEIWHAQFNV